LPCVLYIPLLHVRREANISVELFSCEIKHEVFAMQPISAFGNERARGMLVSYMNSFLFNKTKTVRGAHDYLPSIIRKTVDTLMVHSEVRAEDQRTAYTKILCATVAHACSSPLALLQKGPFQTDRRPTRELDDALTAAAAVGNLPLVEYFIGEGADVTCKTPFFGDPIEAAAYHGQTEVLWELLRRLPAGPIVTTRIGARRPGRRRLFVSSPARKALLAAIPGNHEETIKLLIGTASASLSLDDMVVMAAAEAGHSNLVRLFLNQAHLVDGWERRNEIFFEASRRGFVSIVRMMLEEENVDVNQVRWLTQDTALQHAAANGQLKVVKILLDAGAQPCDTDGNALYRAAKYGHEEVVKVLLEHGYDINGFGAEDTALVTAAEKGHFRMVKLLINLGADLTAGHCGEIALHRAAANNHADVARLLIEKGVNIGGVEKRLAPMLGVLVMEHDGMVQMLKDMGAKNVQAMASLCAKRVVDGEYPNETYRSSPDWPRSMGTSSRKSSLAT